MTDFRNVRVHFVGIGGISLSALAVLVLARGGVVSGSDTQPSRITDKLERLGVKVYYSHDASNVCGANLVVLSCAIHDDNPECVEAKRLGIKTIGRAELLAEISSEYLNVITIAGSHGKTTTTGMVASCLKQAGLEPTIHIGGEMESIDGNVFVGDKYYFVTEACEYKDSFLSFKNQAVSCVLNVQEDHMDYFKTKNNLQNSFIKYLKNTNKNGICVINTDDEFLDGVKVDRKIITYAVKNKNADYVAKNVRECKWGKYSFDVFKRGEKVIRVKLPCMGKHQIYNALACVAICDWFGIDLNVIAKGLAEFSGIKRRFEEVGSLNGAKVFHDYAHHPTEIQANIKATKRFTKGKVIVVFQPHTFTRTRDLWDEFANCFCAADEVCVFKIYPAREPAILGITAESLAEAVRGVSGCVWSSNDYCELYNQLKAKVAPNDTVLILGAGSIESFCELFKH